jgi:hypothetical protein
MRFRFGSDGRWGKQICAWVGCAALVAGALWGQGSSGGCPPIAPEDIAIYEFGKPSPLPGCTYVYKIVAANDEKTKFNVWRYTSCSGNQGGPVWIYDSNLESTLDAWYMGLCGKTLPPLNPAPQARPTASAAQPASQSSYGAGSQGFIMADLNGDGIPDQIYLNSSGVTVGLLNSDQSVQSTNQFPTGFSPDPAYSTIVAADFNGDGKIDLAVSDDGEVSSTAGGVAILLGNGDGTFQAAKYFAAGQNPGPLAAADFNGDGKIDLAAASTYVASVYILNGNGDGTFQAPTSYAPGGDSQSTPASILAIDLNGDGKPDLAIANQGSVTVANSSISTLLNTGSGFSAAFNAPLPLPLLPAFLGYGELNGDGKPDLVALSTQASALIVLFGNGDGTFTTPSAYATGNSPGSVGFIPLDDGNTIIITPDQTTGSLWQTVVSPEGDVGAPPIHLVGGLPTGIAAADLDGNGQPDAIVTGGASDVSVLLLKNDVFQPPVGYSLAQPSPMPQAVATGDLNNDGKPDVVVASLEGMVSVLLGNGDGTLKAPVNVPVNAGAQSIALADFNRDGKLDAVVAASGNLIIGGGTGTGGVVVLLGAGNGTLSAQPTLTVSGLYATSVAAADLNGDGIPDLAVVMITGTNFGSATLAVFLGNGDGTFQAPRTFPLKAPAASFTKVIGNQSGIVIGDWNGDGKPDIAAVADTEIGAAIDILLGDGTGNFTEVSTLPATADDPIYLATADLNGDRKADLIVAHSGGEGTYLLGNGDGTFQAEWQLPTGTSPSAFAIIPARTYTDILSADNVGAMTAVSLAIPAAPPALGGRRR